MNIYTSIFFMPVDFVKISMYRDIKDLDFPAWSYLKPLLRKGKCDEPGSKERQGKVCHIRGKNLFVVAKVVNGNDPEDHCTAYTQEFTDFFCDRMLPVDITDIIKPHIQGHISLKRNCVLPDIPDVAPNDRIGLYRPELEHIFLVVKESPAGADLFNQQGFLGYHGIKYNKQKYQYYTLPVGELCKVVFPLHRNSLYYQFPAFQRNVLWITYAG